MKQTSSRIRATLMEIRKKSSRLRVPRLQRRVARRVKLKKNLSQRFQLGMTIASYQS